MPATTTFLGKFSNNSKAREEKVLRVRVLLVEKRLEHLVLCCSIPCLFEANTTSDTCAYGFRAEPLQRQLMPDCMIIPVGSIGGECGTQVLTPSIARILKLHGCHVLNNLFARILVTGSPTSLSNRQIITKIALHIGGESEQINEQ